MSISILVSYVFLGFTLAAPIGPVNSARLEKGIKNGFWHAWVVGFGSMLADACFMLMVYLGMVQFLGIPVVQIFLWIFGAFILIYTGIESIIKANTLTFTSIRDKDSLLKCFLIGFFMSITSPLSILFWLGIYGSVLAKTAQTNGTESLLIYSGMIFLGLTFWDVLVAAMTSGFRKVFDVKSLIIISILSGISLIIFGIYFGYQGVLALVK